jgi:hypothetical protein
VKILQGDGLRADVSSAENVVFVATNVQTLVSLNGDFDTTDRFAEIAGAVVGAVCCHGKKSYPQITQI